ncbi:hypothetical protein ACSFCM_18740 [Enterococcus gilvus]
MDYKLLRAVFFYEVTGFGKEVTLLELDEPNFVPHYKIEQVVESTEGHFIKLKLIETI